MTIALTIVAALSLWNCYRSPELAYEVDRINSRIDLTFDAIGEVRRQNNGIV